VVVNILELMSGSITDDLINLGKIFLLTFFLLGFIVIYNQKVFEGIILLSIVCQLLILWILVDNYDLVDTLKSYFETTNASTSRRYFFISVLALSFILAFFFIFRAVIIIQNSYIEYGVIKSQYYSDIIIAMAIGLGILILFIILIINNNKILKGSNQKLMVPNLLILLLIFMLSNHI
jgi:hypothetical protein